jgi:hypothetical protein
MRVHLVSISSHSRKCIQFGVFSQQDIAKAAEFEITQRDLYTIPERVPVKNGVLDLRLVHSIFEYLWYIGHE